MKLMKKVILWLARKEMRKHGMLQYERGWEHGVKQQRYEPESTLPFETYDEEGRRWE